MFFLVGVIFLGVREVKEVREVKAITFAGSESTVGGRALPIHN